MMSTLVVVPEVVAKRASCSTVARQYRNICPM